MRRMCLASSLLLILWGCAPLPPGNDSTISNTSSTSNATMVASAIPPATPEITKAPRMPEPDLPAGVLKPLQPVAVLQPKMQDTEAWYANSGISDNRLGFYATKKSVAEIEAELLPTFVAGKNRPYIEGVGPVFDFEGTRVCLMRRGETDIEELFVLVPLGDPPVVPKSLKALKLPAIPPGTLKGRKTLVILATGKGLGEHVDHMLGQAGLVIDPTPAPSETATPAESLTPTETVTPSPD